MKMENKPGEKTPLNQEVDPETDKPGEGENLKSKGQIDTKTVLAQKEHFKSKFEKSEEEKNKLLAELERLRGKKVEQPSSEGKVDPIDLVTTISALKDFSPEELIEIKAYASGKGISLVEASKSDFIKNAIAMGRKSVEDEHKIPGTTNRGKSMPDKKLSDLNKKEIKDNWKEVMRKAIESGKRKKREDLGI
ncbi:MAG: hypothetical protein ACTSPI_04275 [Candidatus Heimdallarchaeaceae archaeon]